MFYRILTTEDVANDNFGSSLPSLFYFSPNNELVTFLLPDLNGKRQIYAMSIDKIRIDGLRYRSPPFLLLDVSMLTSDLQSPDEQLRNERIRSFSSGISAYQWINTIDSSNKIMIPINGEIFVVLIDSIRVTKVCQIYDGSQGDAIDPHFSPDGSKIAFTIKDDLYIQYIEYCYDEVTSQTIPKSCKPVRLTHEGSSDGISAGVADYLAQQEMGRFSGYWWSPDNEKIAFCVCDEHHIPEYEIFHQGSDDPRKSEKHRYPFAGCQIPKIELKVISIPSLESCRIKETTSWKRNSVCICREVIFPEDTKLQVATMDLPDSSPDGSIVVDDFYLGRVGWWPDGTVMAQVQNRNHTALQLLRLDPFTGSRQVLVEERSSIWINLHNLCHGFSSSFRPHGHQESDDINNGEFYFLWGSERSGFCQLYMYYFNPSLETAICQRGGRPIGPCEEYVVDQLCDVDETNGTVYFMSSYTSVLEKHLYSALLSVTGNSKIEKISQAIGWHEVKLSVAAGFYLDMFSSISQPLVVTIASLDLETRISVYDAQASTPELVELRKTLQTPTFRTVRSRDGKFDLNCVVYMPINTTNSIGPFPAVMSAFGGLHVQRVFNSWDVTADLRSQKLAQHGYIVIKVDNRGSSRRGLQFEGAIKGDLGNVEIDDQIAALQSLGNDVIDFSRVAMLGWSYGGYMSAMSLCRYPGTFKCAVSGSPFTSWDGYNTYYTEKYLGNPDSNKEEYRNSSVISWAPAMTGRLMLIHGMIDANVHFRNTARLINSLVEHRKLYDLVIFPSERHSPQKAQSRIYMEERMMSFIDDQLS